MTGVCPGGLYALVVVCHNFVKLVLSHVRLNTQTFGPLSTAGSFIASVGGDVLVL
jgi:hypothetical protein